MVQTGEAGKTTQSDLFEGDLAGVWLDTWGWRGKDHWQDQRGVWLVVLSFDHGEVE